ncbi:alpha/beta hydrolase [uncultured Draconibacterium sp.]|uniref:alpha/beta hydrolase n=1 Tax=uncultured Draconibacterium sp. TaxID=1573823 RepID=UPI00321761EA
MKKMNTILLILALLNLQCNTEADPEIDQENPFRMEYFNLAYASESNTQKLDIYLPVMVLEKNPVVVLIHGGAWRVGDKSNFRTNARWSEVVDTLRSRGYAVVPINYRLSGEAKFPAQIYDVKASIRWIKANAENYKIDSERIGVWGQSAGGHLAALAGVSENIEVLEDFAQGNENVSSSIQAVVDWYGPTDFLKMDSMTIAQGCATANHSLANSGESELIGFPIESRSDLVALANPITYITEVCPPFLIEHGLNDCTVPFGQGQLLYESLLPVLGSEHVKLNLLQNSGHGNGLFTEIATVENVIDFLDAYLK